MRKEVSFSSKGLTCRGWLYPADGIEAGDKMPTVVMAHGFSGVKEQGLPAVAARFAKAGFGALVSDFRTFGSSDGVPRCQIFPLDMVEDYRNAITRACEQPYVDSDRIALWGTSFSGGLATYTATVDKRIKAVVAQTPSLLNAETRRATDPARWESAGRFLMEDRNRKIPHRRRQLHEGGRPRRGGLRPAGQRVLRGLHGT